MSRCEGRAVPPFAAEIGTGFPPFFPPIAEDDSLYTLMCALAYGLRGYNLYMAVIGIAGLVRPSTDTASRVPSRRTMSN